ncbi:MAG: diacylglycerol/lipid kinase family protein [Rudaea sp.]
MRALVFHNPTAGANGHEKEDILAALRLADIDAKYFSTKRGDLTKAFDSSADFVVAAGGDGTVAMVLRLLPDRKLPVAILPLGTANNLARSLGIAGTPQELVETWQLEHICPLDIGVAHLGGGRELFLEAFGVGPSVSKRNSAIP